MKIQYYLNNKLMKSNNFYKDFTKKNIIIKIINTGNK